MDRGIYSGDIYKKENPIPGKDLKITIDINLQNFIYESFKKKDKITMGLENYQIYIVNLLQIAVKYPHI